MADWYKPIFAAVYDPVMSKIEQGRMARWRAELLQNLEGNVLEIGSGTGANFPFYSPQVRLLATDPSHPMLEKAKMKAPSGLNVRFFESGIGDYALDQMISPSSLDAIVSTLVLCTVQDPQSALDRFMKWLKPGGKVILIEHIHAQNPILKRIQHIVNPIWKSLADGCNLTRNTDQLFHSSDFLLEEEHYEVLAVRWYRAVYTKPI